MPAPQQGQPPQQGVDKHEDDPRVQARDGQQMGQAAARICLPQFGGQRTPLACGHRFDDGGRLGRHPQPCEAVDGRNVQPRGCGFQSFEYGSFADPQRPGISAALHEPTVALRASAERTDRPAAPQPFAGLQLRERVGVELQPDVGGVPVPVGRIAPRLHGGIGGKVAAAVGGKSLDGNLIKGVGALRDGQPRSPELRRGKSRGEQHRNRRGRRAQQQGQHPRQHESRREKPRRQRVPCRQGNPRGEGCEESEHRHAFETFRETGEVHAEGLRRFGDER